MKELSITLLKIFGIFQFLSAIESSGEIPLRIYLSPDKDAQTYLWLFQDVVFPFAIALLVFFFAGNLASAVVKEASDISVVNPENLLPVGVFFLGIYIFTISAPSLLSGLYNIYSNEFPSLKGMHSRGAIHRAIMVLISVVFIIRPNLFGALYSKVST